MENFQEKDMSAQNAEKKKKLKRDLQISGIVIGLVGLALFVSCFVWFVLMATEIESTRAQKILPMILFLLGLVLCFVGAILSSYAKRGNAEERQEQSDGSFEEKLRQNRLREKRRKPKLGEISLEKLGDVYGDKAEEVTPEQEVVESKVEQLQEQIEELEEKLEQTDMTTQMQEKTGVQLNFDEEKIEDEGKTVLGHPDIEPLKVDSPQISQVEIDKPDMGEIVVERGQNGQDKTTEIEKKIRGEK